MNLDETSKLPRFNMPLELGLFLGAKHFGGDTQKGKRFTILDSEPYRYQQAISDISGQDIQCHKGNVDEAIRCVRNWLKTVSKRKIIPGASYIQDRFHQYETDLPDVCAILKYDTDDLTFNDLWETMVEWQKVNT